MAAASPVGNTDRIHPAAWCAWRKVKVDGGSARDPLIGAHEPGDGGFEIPMPGGRPLMLRGLRRFTRTRGVAYLFYPSVTTLGRMARNEVFLPLHGDFE